MLSLPNIRMDLEYNKYEFKGDELDTPVKVVRIEQDSPYKSDKAHRHNYNEIFFFESGGGEHMIDFNTHTIKSNSIHSVVANKVHLVNRANNSFGFVLLLKNDFFQSEILKSNYAFLIECEIINLTSDRFSQQIKLIKEIETELQSNNLMINEVLTALIHLILLKLKQYIKQDKTNKYENLTENKLYKSFYLLLEKKFKTQRTTQYYANKLNLSSAALNKELQRATGKSITKLIQNRLLLESKRLLFHSDLSIKEIVFHLNFSDSAHFSHFFKNKVNMSPIEYRKKQRIYKE